MRATTIAVISPGDMGHVVGQRLAGHGARVVTSLRGRSERTRRLAARAGITDLDTLDAAVAEADLILSILVPEQAVAAADAVAGALRAAGRTLLYADCNAVSPQSARRMAELIDGAGARFVDASIIGPPPRRPEATRFYASGPHADGLAELAAGLDVRVLGPVVGHASALKMAYAALTKGVSALATELLVAAHAYGLYEPLVDELALSQGDVLRRLERTLPSMPPKAGRWVGEMREIADTFAAVGLTPRMLEGAAELYRFVAGTAPGGETPEDRDPERTLHDLVGLLAGELDRATAPAPSGG